ncbi:tRNA (N6-threonylcarbamoyladenosine(37)-N6)-methyltransferase TrmO [Salicola sp. Rm-C-2C1-2]|uniref:tRNA (N6-threonylcarbamoyladenosine(37)-N6)-methyltransferase TrmO n=1 Tax=Salicola sp. Rm-C-2C1-2 TaxID=3141321 RepID=UPI0032E37875
MSQPPTITPIGTVHSCFPDKFGVPRQPSLCPHARGDVVLHPPWNNEEAFRGLENFSHIWITFLFHQIPAAHRPSTLVRPPRLGGNTRVGVFASRSPFRPNRLGLSLVRNQGLIQHNEDLRLAISEIDLVNDTPVLDIKPFLPWCDAPQSATAAWASEPPRPALGVRFSCEAEQQLQQFQGEHPELRELIREVLSQDPRPAYHQDDPQHHYALRLHQLDIHWFVADGSCVVKRLDNA